MFGELFLNVEDVVYTFQTEGKLPLINHTRGSKKKEDKKTFSSF